MSVRFYNAGGAIDAMIPFDHPTNDPKNANTVSYYHLLAPSDGFFDVPTELVVQTDQGELNVAVAFAKRIKEDYRQVGVVMINPRPRNPIADEDNLALTDKEAKAKAEDMWQDAMFRLVREHETRCLEARNNGFKPKRAFGNVAHALKTLGIEDPANDVEDVMRRKQDVSEVAELKRQVEELKTLMLAGGKGK